MYAGKYGLIAQALWHIKKKGHWNKITDFPLLNDLFDLWIRSVGMKKPDGGYLFEDHSASILILGARRTGKTALAFIIIKKIMEADPDKTLILFNVSPEVPKYLREKAGFKKVIVKETFEDLTDPPFNSVIFVDEAIINMNAKRANTTDAVALEGLMAVLSHKRSILILTTQTFALFKQARLQSNIAIYRQITTRMYEEERNRDYVLQKYGEILIKLPIKYAIMEISLPGSYLQKLGDTGKEDRNYQRVGRLEINKSDIPEWYGPILSEPYKERGVNYGVNLIMRKRKKIKSIAVEVLKQMLEHGMVPNPKDRAMMRGLRGLIAEKYADRKLSGPEITDIINYMFSMLTLGPLLKENGDIFSEVIPGMDGAPDISDVAPDTTVPTEEETRIALMWALGNSLKTIEEHFIAEGKKEGHTRADLLEMIRKVTRYLLLTSDAENAEAKGDRRSSYKVGVKFEQIVSKFRRNAGAYCIISAGSGGKRGKLSVAPDMIEINPEAGEIRFVQIKLRDRHEEYFPPGSFAAEIEMAEILNELTGKEIASAWIYYQVKGKPISNMAMVKLDLQKAKTHTLRLIYSDYGQHRYVYIKPSVVTSDLLKNKDN